MTRLATRTRADWRWVRYRRASRKREDGRKLYVCHFRVKRRPMHASTVRISLWAHRPAKALRSVCNSGCDPVEFDGEAVN